MKSLFFLSILTLGLIHLAYAQQVSPKRIYIGNGDHTDYMWSTDEAGYRQAFLDMLDYYLNQADATQNNSSPYQSRFNCDGNFFVWVYENNRTAAQMSRLADRIRDGHITVPYNSLNSCYGAPPAEAILRGMYYAGTLERRFNLKLTMATSIENQTLPYGLASLWAGAGAKYSWMGICGCATQVPSAGNREHEIYWWTGPDGSRILMKWNSLINGNQSIGGYSETAQLASIVGFLDTNSQFQALYPYNIIGAYQYGADAIETTISTFPSTASSQTNANRQVIVSNEQDFFDDFSATYGAALPAEGRSYGNEWDLYSASMAEVSARVKRAVEKLRSAEALATLVCLRQPGFMDGRKTARRQAWIDLGNYWELNWTADGSVSRDARAAWERKLAGEIESYVNTLFADASTSLGLMIDTTGAVNPRFYVFNPLSWTRTGGADLLYTVSGPLHVVDIGTSLEVPSQMVTVAGRGYLRLLAANVPPVGYKVFEIVPGPGAGFSNAATVSGGVIENSIYRLNVAASGAITSLIDKTRGNREFAQAVDGRALNDLGGSGGALQVENAGPVSVTILATGASPLQHTSRITLTRDSGLIDLRNTIDQNFNSVFTWASVSR